MKIVISDNMEKEVIEKMKELGEVVYKPENLDETVKDADVLVVRSATKVTKELIEKGNMKIVARAGVGLDNIDLKACEEKGIKVINTPEASANAVAEITIGVIISMLRNVQKAYLQMKNGEWRKKELVGKEIRGKTLGIIGFGRIGHSVAEKANALGMKVIAYDRKKKESKFVEFVSLDELYEKSDVISLHTVLVPETENIINEESISKMKEGIYLVNYSRGGLIDEDALYEACKKGKVAGAALDVYSSEPYKGKLLELDNVYFTPHIGGSTKEAQMRIGEELIEKIKG